MLMAVHQRENSHRAPQTQISGFFSSPNSFVFVFRKPRRDQNSPRSMLQNHRERGHAARTPAQNFPRAQTGSGTGALTPAPVSEKNPKRESSECCLKKIIRIIINPQQGRKQGREETVLLTQIAEMNIKTELLIDWLMISTGRSLPAIRKTEYLKALGK